MIRLPARVIFIFTFLILFSVNALAQTHSIWSKKVLNVRDGETNTMYKSFKRQYAAAAWTEKSRNGYFRALAEVPPGQTYEFILVAIGNSDAGSITGLWDVMRSGTMVCRGCVGKAYSPNQPAGTGTTNLFKIVVGDSDCYRGNWQFIGIISDQYDF